MLRKISLILFFILLFNVKVFPKNFLSEIEMGFSGAYGFSFQTADFQNLPGVPSCCPNYTGGSGTVFSLGPLVRYNLSTEIFLETRILYHHISGLMKESETINLIIDGKSYAGQFNYNLESNLNLITIEPSVGYKITNEFTASAGLLFGVQFSGTYNSYEQLMKPENRGTFNNGKRIRNESQGNIPDLYSIQAGLKFGIAYRFPLKKKSDWYLSPELNYNYYFTNIASGLNWKTSFLELGVSVAGKIFKEGKPPALPPVTPPLPQYPEFPVPEKKEADISAIKIDSNGNEIPQLPLRLEDIVTFNMRPLLNYIFFDFNSSTIPSRYNKLTKEETVEFNMKSVHELDPLQTYYQILNLIGKKLKDNPDYQIKLIGTNSNIGLERNNKELSKARAETVKNYLTEIWNIPEEKITIIARNLPEDYSKSKESEAIEENRRVEILPSNKSILEPILTLDTIPNPEKVKFRFVPKVSNEEEIENWKIDISIGPHLIQSLTGNGTIPTSVEWTPTEKDFLEDFETNEINYQLTINYFQGESIQSDLKNIPIEKVTIEKKKLSGANNKIVDYYRLILFDFGKTNLLKEHSGILDFIRKRINPDSKVTITGFTDRIGEKEINIQIAKKRAEKVAALLAIPGTEIISKGEEELLFDNTYPEGRFYCRTVNIVVENPIK